MEEQGQIPRQSTPPPEGGWEKDTVSILDLLLVIAHHRRLIGMFTGVFFIVALVSVTVDRNTDIMSISVTTGDPLLSVQLTQTFIHHLTERVQYIYTQKARENLEFIRARFMKSQYELEEAEEGLAKFTDRN